MYWERRGRFEMGEDGTTIFFHCEFNGILYVSASEQKSPYI